MSNVTADATDSCQAKPNDAEEMEYKVAWRGHASEAARILRRKQVVELSAYKKVELRRVGDKPLYEYSTMKR